MKIREDLNIKTYKDFKKHQHEIFDIISETMELIIEETTKKNPTFLIKDYDKLPTLGDLE